MCPADTSRRIEECTSRVPPPFSHVSLIPASPIPCSPPPPRLTDLADGQVLSVSCWHALADGGRIVELMGRISQHYRREGGASLRAAAGEGQQACSVDTAAAA